MVVRRAGVHTQRRGASEVYPPMLHEHKQTQAEDQKQAQKQCNPGTLTYRSQSAVKPCWVLSMAPLCFRAHRVAMYRSAMPASWSGDSSAAGPAGRVGARWRPRGGLMGWGWWEDGSTESCEVQHVEQARPAAREAAAAAAAAAEAEAAAACNAPSSGSVRARMPGSSPHSLLLCQQPVMMTCVGMGVGGRSTSVAD
jgi:hypothetical protein